MYSCGTIEKVGIDIFILQNTDLNPQNSDKNLPTFASVAIIEKEDETEIHRSRLAEGGLVDRFPNRPDAQTLFDNFMETVKLHNARPFLGQRDDHSTEFRWESYGEILERATNIGSSLIHFGLQRVCSFFYLFFIISDFLGYLISWEFFFFLNE